MCYYLNVHFQGQRVKSQASVCEICGLQTGTGTVFFLKISFVLSSHYNSTGAPYSPPNVSDTIRASLINTNKNRDYLLELGRSEIGSECVKSTELAQDWT